MEWGTGNRPASSLNSNECWFDKPPPLLHEMRIAHYQEVAEMSQAMLQRTQTEVSRLHQELLVAREDQQSMDRRFLEIRQEMSQAVRHMIADLKAGVAADTFHDKGSELSSLLYEVRQGIVELKSLRASEDGHMHRLHTQFCTEIQQSVIDGIGKLQVEQANLSGRAKYIPESTISVRLQSDLLRTLQAVETNQARLSEALSRLDPKAQSDTSAALSALLEIAKNTQHHLLDLPSKLGTVAPFDALLSLKDDLRKDIHTVAPFDALLSLKDDLRKDIHTVLKALQMLEISERQNSKTTQRDLLDLPNKLATAAPLDALLSVKDDLRNDIYAVSQALQMLEISHRQLLGLLEVRLSQSPIGDAIKNIRLLEASGAVRSQTDNLPILQAIEMAEKRMLEAFTTLVHQKERTTHLPRELQVHQFKLDQSDQVEDTKSLQQPESHGAHSMRVALDTILLMREEVRNDLQQISKSLQGLHDWVCLNDVQCMTSLQVSALDLNRPAPLEMLGKLKSGLAAMSGELNGMMPELKKC